MPRTAGQPPPAEARPPGRPRWHPRHTTAAPAAAGRGVLGAGSAASMQGAAAARPTAQAAYKRQAYAPCRHRTSTMGSWALCTAASSGVWPSAELRLVSAPALQGQQSSKTGNQTQFRRQVCEFVKAGCGPWGYRGNLSGHQAAEPLDPANLSSSATVPLSPLLMASRSGVVPFASRTFVSAPSAAGQPAGSGSGEGPQSSAAALLRRQAQSTQRRRLRRQAPARRWRSQAQQPARPTHSPSAAPAAGAGCLAGPGPRTAASRRWQDPLCSDRPLSPEAAPQPGRAPA